MKARQGTDVAKVLFEGIESTTGLAAMKCGGIVDAIHTVGNGLSGGVGVLAKVLVKQEYNDEDLKSAYTFALLLINRMTTDFRENNTQCTYHLGLLADAFSDYEKLTGVKPDQHLIEQMVEIVRDENKVAEARIKAVEQAKMFDGQGNVVQFPRLH